MTSLVVTLVLFTAAGAGTARLLSLPLPRAIAPRAAAAFVYGAAAEGVALYLLGAAGVPLRRWTFALVPLLLASALLRRSSRTARDGQRDRHPLPATLLMAGAFAAMLYSAAATPVRDYDGRVTWLPKAREIAFTGALDGPLFRGESGASFHNHYPVLVPLDVAAVMALSGNFDDDAARWFYPLLSIATLLFARELLARRFSDVAGWVIAATAWVPMLGRSEGGVLSAYCDLPLAGFAGLAALWLACGDEQEATRPAALLLAASVLTKNEGLLLAGAVIAGGVAARRGRLRTLMLPAAATAAAVLLVAAWRSRIPAAYDEQYTILLRELPHSLGRVGTAVRALVRYASERLAWGWFWPAVLVSALVALAGKLRGSLLLPGVAILVSMGGFVAALSVTSWDADLLASVAANRLLLQVLYLAAGILAAGGQTVVDRIAGQR